MSRLMAITTTQPGIVAHAYHTMGPIKPSEYMTFTVRRTQYLQRPGGVSRELHPMWPEREGGNLAMIEGTMTFKKDTPLDNMNVLWMVLLNFPKDGSNIPLWGIRRSNDSLLICGPQQSVYTVAFRPALASKAMSICLTPAAISPRSRRAKASPPHSLTSERALCLPLPSETM